MTFDLGDDVGNVVEAIRMTELVNVLQPVGVVHIDPVSSTKHLLRLLSRKPRDCHALVGKELCDSLCNVGAEDVDLPLPVIDEVQKLPKFKGNALNFISWLDVVHLFFPMKQHS